MLTPYKPKDLMKPYFVSAIDIETAPDGKEIGVVFAWDDPEDGRQHRAYNDFDEWWEFFTEKWKDSDKLTRKRLQYIYAHNGAAFDYIALLQWASNKGILNRVKFIVAGSYGIGLDITIGRVRIKLRDSVRLMPGKLDNLTQDFDVEHKKITDENATHYKSDMATYKRLFPEEFWKYAINDVLGLQEVIKSFWEMIVAEVGNIGMLPLTLPALAHRLWRMTLKDPIMIPWSKTETQFERRGYTGGRTETYQTGRVYGTIYDANSLYPSVMLGNEYPTSSSGFWTDTYDGKHGMYEIEYMQTNRKQKPVLRDEESNEFRYEGSGVYCQPEVQKLLDVGAEISVKKGYIYRSTGRIFDDFVSKWYSIRLRAEKEGNKALKYVCKILMNSLYGKFGQKEQREEIVFWDAARRKQAINDGEKFYDKGEYCIRLTEDKSEVAFPGIAAYVTAYARLNLYAELEKAINANAGIHGCDTDSIHVSGYQMETGDNLGQWKQEYPDPDTGETVGEIFYLGKKLYAKGTEIKAKGIGRDSSVKLDRDTFEYLARTGEDLPVDFKVFPSIREALFKGKPVAVSQDRRRTIRRDPGLPFVWMVAGDLSAD